jgi:alcohol dehydrogenase, propanol-preferring
MRAWALCAFGEPLREIDLPTPEPAGTQVLLEVTHCGVCHSDLHAWEGYYDMGGGRRVHHADRGVVLPLALGHEITGRVVALGPDARGVRTGDLRVVYPWAGCGDCAVCRAEEDHMCPNPRSLGFYRHGGFASHVLAAHPRHLVDPGPVDPAVAATYACSGITVHSAVAKVMPMDPDEPLVVVGAGGLGLNAVAVLRAMGHRAIVVVDISPAKRDAALAAGATTTVDGSGDGVTRRIKAACGGAVGAVVDLVNSTGTARFSLGALRSGGTLVQVGLFGGELTLPLPMMAVRALTVRGSFVGSPKDLRAVVALAAEGGLAPLPVETVPHDRATQALMRLRAGEVTGRIVLRTPAA